MGDIRTATAEAVPTTAPEPTGPDLAAPDRGAPDPAAPDLSGLAEAAAALRLSVGRIARRLRQAHATGDLALAEVSVLARLDRDGPDSPGALAALERVRPQAMAATVASLEDRGLVSRRQHEADARRAVIAVTDAGRKVLAERRSESVRLLAGALEAEFTAAELGSLLAALPLLDRLAERL